MKCKNCGCEVICIRSGGRSVVCDAAPITYWSVRDGASMSEMLSLLTPNGESIYGTPAGKLENAVWPTTPTLADCCPSSTVAGIAGAARSTMTERVASWWTWTRELAENRTSARSRATPLTVNPATR